MSQKSIMSFFKTKGTISKSPSKLPISSEIVIAENEIEETEKGENINSLEINSPKTQVTSEDIMLSPYGHKIPLRKTASRKINLSKIKDIENKNLQTETEIDLEYKRIPLKEIDIKTKFKNTETSKCINILRNEESMEIEGLSNMLPEVEEKNDIKDEFKSNDMACNAMNINNSINNPKDLKKLDNIYNIENSTKTYNIDLKTQENNGVDMADKMMNTKRTTCSSKGKKRTRTYLSSSEEEEIDKISKEIDKNSEENNKETRIKRSLMILSSESECEMQNDLRNNHEYQGNSDNEKKFNQKEVNNLVENAKCNKGENSKVKKCESYNEYKDESLVHLDTSKEEEINKIKERNKEFPRILSSENEISSNEDESNEAKKLKTKRSKSKMGKFNKKEQKSCESGNESVIENESEKSGNRKKIAKDGEEHESVKTNNQQIDEIQIKAGKPNVISENSKVKKDMHSFFTQNSLNKNYLNNSSEKESAKIATTIKNTDNNISMLSSINDLNFDPSKNHYNYVLDACWKSGENVPYIALAKTFESIESTSARLRSIEILSNIFGSIIALSPTDLLFSVYLCLNKVAPAYEAVELGIGDTLLMKVIAQATGRSMDKLKIDVQEKGDIGLIAEASRTTQKTMFKPKNLTIQFVFKKLKEIALMSGNSVMTKKVDLIKSIYVACRQSEARYLMRSLSGKLRIGLAEQSVLHALAWAVAVNNYPSLTGEALKKKVEETALIIKTSYCNCPNYDLLIPALLNSPLSDLPQKCKLTPGIPLKPMLAHPTKQIGEVLDRFGDSEFVCEYKYDGERAQIHLLDNGLVEIYSRNQENNTKKYPDIVERIRNACKQTMPILNENDINANDVNVEKIKVSVEEDEEIDIKENNGKIIDDNKISAILDCEAVAWNSDDKHILPFQVLSTRKRKDANIDEIKVQVCVFVFDLLYLNGISLVTQPLRKRRELLRQNFQEIEGEFFFAKDRIASDADQVSEFLEESIKGNCEGLMVKTLDVEATYEIAKRSRNWLKLKKDYLDGVGDTLDLVVIGAYYGTGRRTGKYGGFLLACYDEGNEEYQSICKIGTGFSDSDLESRTNFLSQHVINSARPYYRYSACHAPDHWFEAIEVWEIKAADLSLSPTHFAAIGLVESDKGISLRFPRFLKVRDDKKPEDATSSKQVAGMYRNQDQIINQQKTKPSNQEADEDFY